MDQSWERAVDRFCRQYLQLEPQLDFPQDAHLQLTKVQEAIYSRLFAVGSIQYGPPARYVVKMLKALVSRIESSIDDWEEHVSFPLGCVVRNKRNKQTKRLEHLLPCVSSVMSWSLTRKVGSI